MKKDMVKLAKPLKPWEGNYDGNNIKSITFCVTEACNLACRYCYMTGKNNKKRMTFETAKKCVDYIFNNREYFNEDSVVWDFIGGEPFLEIDLIDKVCDYIKLQMFMLDHPWLDSYRFNFSSNGLLYCSDKVQKYITKNRDHLSIGISIDGNKTKHDLQRVYPDGRGSYDDVMKNVQLWKQQFTNAGTKATFSHDDLPHLKDSIISLWENGIKSVAANVVFEDVWQDGDDGIMEKQLDELGDYILENKLWNECYVRFFDPMIGNLLKKDNLDSNFCGSGKMLAIDCEGNFYPCIRFTDFSLEKRKGRCIGNAETGINEDKLRAFKVLTVKEQSREECLECEVASGCALCTGFNYDDSGSIYNRVTYICKLHKATVRANKRFWSKYERITGNPSPRRQYEDMEDKKYIVILTNDKATPYCSYRNWHNSNNMMSEELINKGIKYAEDNGFEVIILGDTGYKNNDNIKYTLLTSESLIHNNSDIIAIYDNNVEKINKEADNCIVLVNENNVDNLMNFVKKAAEYNKRINITVENLENWSQQIIEEYKNQLDKLTDFVEETYLEHNPIELNILTDRLYLNKHDSCTAGEKTYTLAPNGNFYICPAFYFNNPDDTVGNINKGIDNKNQKLMSLKYAPICKKCDAYQCKRCKFLNKKLTDEYNIPSKMQCLVSHYERIKSEELQQRLLGKRLIPKFDIIDKIDYLDPLEKIIKQKKNA